MDTVAEFALRRRIAELERELLIARREKNDYRPTTEVTPPPSISLDHPAPQRLLLATSWNVDYDDAGRYCVRAEAWCDGEPKKFGMIYYLDEQHLLSAHDALYVLGEEHKRVIQRLAEHYTPVDWRKVG